MPKAMNRRLHGINRLTKVAVDTAMAPESGMVPLESGPISMPQVLTSALTPSSVTQSTDLEKLATVKALPHTTIRSHPRPKPV